MPKRLAPPAFEFNIPMKLHRPCARRSIRQARCSLRSMLIIETMSSCLKVSRREASCSASSSKHWRLGAVTRQGRTSDALQIHQECLRLLVCEYASIGPSRFALSKTTGIRATPNELLAATPWKSRCSSRFGRGYTATPRSHRISGDTPSLGQRVEILHERAHRSLHPCNFWIAGIDQIILIRSMRAGPVSQPEMSRRKAKRRGGEDVSRPGAGGAGPELGIQAELAVSRDLRLDELRILRSLRRIVASAHIDLDIAKAVFGEVILQ